MFFDEGEDFFCGGIADHHHHRVVGSIVSPIVFPAILDRQVLQIRIPADDRPTVGMLFVGQGKKLFDGQPEWTIDRPELALTADHFPFRLQCCGCQIKIGQAIRLQLHGQFELVGGKILIIRGVIGGGKGIEGPPVGLDDAGKFLGFHPVGSLEHHVLEEMGHPRNSRSFIAGSGGEMDLEGNDGKSVNLSHQDEKAVGQAMFLHFRVELHLLHSQWMHWPGQLSMASWIFSSGAPAGL